MGEHAGPRGDWGFGRGVPQEETGGLGGGVPLGCWNRPSVINITKLLGAGVSIWTRVLASFFVFVAAAAAAAAGFGKLVQIMNTV